MGRGNHEVLTFALLSGAVMRFIFSPLGILFCIGLIIYGNVKTNYEMANPIEKPVRSSWYMENCLYIVKKGDSSRCTDESREFDRLERRYKRQEARGVRTP